MTKDIEVQVDAEVVDSKNIRITPYGVEFENKPTIEEWHKAVQGVQKIHGMMQFYLGDLMVFAESPVTGWGENKYEDLMVATGYDYNVLANMTRVARRFDPKFREEILNVNIKNPVPFTAFQEVASLEDVPAKYYLEMVRDSRWTIAKLREEVAKFKNKGILPKKVEKNVVQWRQDVKDSLKKIIDSEPETIIIRSMRNGKVVAEEIVEIPQE